MKLNSKYLCDINVPFYVVVGLQNENGRLQSKCLQLEQEIMALETKYRKCVEKAKDVIKCYEPRLITGLINNLKFLSEKNLIRKQIEFSDSPQMAEKNADSENELLVASSHSQPAMSPLEERLMATAFHK